MNFVLNKLITYVKNEKKRKIMWPKLNQKAYWCVLWLEYTSSARKWLFCNQFQRKMVLFFFANQCSLISNSSTFLLNRASIATLLSKSCLETGIFLDQWKKENILPIYKKKMVSNWLEIIDSFLAPNFWQSF